MILQTRNSELVIYVLVQLFTKAEKRLSMPHLSNKREVFEMTTTQRTGYRQVNTVNLDYICCYDLEVRSP